MNKLYTWDPDVQDQDTVTIKGSLCDSAALWRDPRRLNLQDPFPYSLSQETREKSALTLSTARVEERRKRAPEKLAHACLMQICTPRTPSFNELGPSSPELSWWNLDRKCLQGVWPNQTTKPLDPRPLEATRNNFPKAPTSLEFMKPLENKTWWKLTCWGASLVAQW